MRFAWVNTIVDVDVDESESLRNTKHEHAQSHPL